MKVSLENKKYTSAKELVEAINNVFTSNSNKIYTKSRLYSELGITKVDNQNWKNSSNLEYNNMYNVLQQAFTLIENELVAGGIENRHNAYFVKFLLNSQFNYIENVNNTSDSKPVNITLSNGSNIALDSGSKNTTEG